MIGLALAMTFAVAYANPIENGGKNLPILLKIILKLQQKSKMNGQA